MDALIVLFLTGLVVLFVGMLKKPSLSLIISLSGLSVAAFLQYNYGNYESVFSKYKSLDFASGSINFSILCILFTFMVILGGFTKIKKDLEHSAEIMALFLFSLCGAICLIGFTDLAMFFLGLEIMSIPLYVLAGIKKNDTKSVEASVKYFFTGSFITCFLLMGIALVYGSTGSFDLAGIREVISIGNFSRPMFIVGLFFITASFLFKVGAAPFHFWGPDVYQGSPDYVTAFMASVVKVAMLFTFFKFFAIIFAQVYIFWSGLIYTAIILSLFIGYLAAISQKQYKRLIAYSSITHSAFALFSLISFNAESINDLFIFTIGYGFSVIALVTISMATENENDEIAYLKGVSRSYPLIGILFIFSLLSLTGIPPFTGFFGKSMLFYNAFLNYPLLVFFGLVSTAIGGYFYLNLIFTSYSSDTNPVFNFKINPIYNLVLVLCAIAILFGWLIML